MEIVLLRHGKPDIDTSGRVSAAAFGRWVAEYDQVGIDNRYQPDDETLERIKRCSFIVCSTMPRSIESAEALNIGDPDLISQMFCECEMPYASWKLLKLSKMSWSIVFRLLQLCGYSSNAESFKAIKKRAEECADQLVELSSQNGSVLLVGHGTLIWFIHKRLLRMGWSGPKKAATAFWEYGVYDSYRNPEHDL